MADCWTDEFDLIDSLLKKASFKSGKDSPVLVPPGDDACLLKPLKFPVITTDTQRENVHFRRDWQTPEEIGSKAVSAALSDLAASYADPVCLFINLAAPKNMSRSYLEALYRGIRSGLKRYGCVLGGGNTSAASALAIDLFAVGESFAGFYPARSNACEGDGVYVTGPLGLARGGLDALEKKNDAEILISHFKSPEARFDAARILATHDVRCVMDISDGLAGDAAHIASASKLSIRLDISDADIPPALISYCHDHNLDAREMMLAGGEDYELLFSCSVKTFDAVRAKLPGAFRVGDCLPFGGRPVLGIPSRVVSFQHGAAGPAPV